MKTPPAIPASDDAELDRQLADLAWKLARYLSDHQEPAQ
jgi:hypothetical protein